jgi:hypothetical protein
MSSHRSYKDSNSTLTQRGVNCGQMFRDSLEVGEVDVRRASVGFYASLNTGSVFGIVDAYDASEQEAVDKALARFNELKARAA